VHALGATGDAARLDDVNKQPQIGQIETHRPRAPSDFAKSGYANCLLCQGEQGSQIRETRRRLTHEPGLSDRQPRL
jgi:hypothetical protein